MHLHHLGGAQTALDCGQALSVNRKLGVCIVQSSKTHHTSPEANFILPVNLKTPHHVYLVDVWCVGAPWVLALYDIGAASSPQGWWVLCLSRACARGCDGPGERQVALSAGLLLLPLALKHIGQLIGVCCFVPVA